MHRSAETHPSPIGYHENQSPNSLNSQPISCDALSLLTDLAAADPYKAAGLHSACSPSSTCSPSSVCGPHAEASTPPTQLTETQSQLASTQHACTGQQAQFARQSELQHASAHQVLYRADRPLQAINRTGTATQHHSLQPLASSPKRSSNGHGRTSHHHSRDPLPNRSAGRPLTSHPLQQQLASSASSPHHQRDIFHPNGAWQHAPFREQPVRPPEVHALRAVHAAPAPLNRLQKLGCRSLTPKQSSIALPQQSTTQHMPSSTVQHPQGLYINAVHARAEKLSRLQQLANDATCSALGPCHQPACPALSLGPQVAFSPVCQTAYGSPRQAAFSPAPHSTFSPGLSLSLQPPFSPAFQSALTPASRSRPPSRGSRATQTVAGATQAVLNDSARGLRAAQTIALGSRPTPCDPTPAGSLHDSQNDASSTFSKSYLQSRSSVTAPNIDQVSAHNSPPLHSTASVATPSVSQSSATAVASSTHCGQHPASMHHWASDSAALSTDQTHPQTKHIIGAASTTSSNSPAPAQRQLPQPSSTTGLHHWASDTAAPSTSQTHAQTRHIIGAAPHSLAVDAGMPRQPVALETSGHTQFANSAVESNSAAESNSAMESEADWEAIGSFCSRTVSKGWLRQALHSWRAAARIHAKWRSISQVHFCVPATMELMQQLHTAFLSLMYCILGFCT